MSEAKAAEEAPSGAGINLSPATDFEIKAPWARLNALVALATIAALSVVAVSGFRTGADRIFLFVALAIFTPVAIASVKTLLRPPRLRIRGDILECGTSTTKKANVAEVRYTGLGLSLALADWKQVNAPPHELDRMSKIAARGPIALQFPNVPFGEYLALRKALGFAAEPADPETKADDAYFFAMAEGGGTGRLANAVVALLIAIWVWQVGSGVPAIAPTPSELANWGGNVPVRTVGGEPWRLITCWFLHAGFIHLFVNVTALWNLGGFVERLFGGVGFLAIYIFGGIVGALASTWFHPYGVSVGASGAIFAIVGATARIGLFTPAGTPVYFAGRLGMSAWNMIFLNVLMTSSNPAIDQAAHVGGAAAGVFAAMLLGDFRMSRRRRWQACIGLAVIAALLTIATILFAERRQPEAYRFARAVERLESSEAATLQAFRSAAKRFESKQIDAAEFARLLDEEVVPRWREAFEPVIDGWDRVGRRDPKQLDKIRAYYSNRLAGFELLRDGIRKNDAKAIQDANAAFRRAQEATDEMAK